MRAFVSKTGFVSNFPKPVLGTAADDVLVRVAAFGINRPDLIQHQASYPPPPGVTNVLGLEAAGTIVEANNTDLIGQEVCTLVPGGAYAEFCEAKWGTCLPIPFQGEDRFIRASGLPENVFTVWKNVFRNLDSRPRKAMLFHGGSSGIGSTAITLAKAFGVERVVVTAGSDEKCEACLGFGADIAVNYKTSRNWTKEIGGQVDFILDIVGGDYLPQNIKCLATGGELKIIGFLQSPVTKELNMSRVLLKSLTISGAVLRSSPQEHKEELCQELKEKVWPLLESEAIRLPARISKVYSGIESAGEALAAMAESHHIGKLVVQV